MGIKGFTAWLHDNFPSAFVVLKQSSPKTFDHVYLVRFARRM